MKYLENNAKVTHQFTPFHTADSKPHGNLSLGRAQHGLVFHWTNGCWDQPRLSLHFPLGETTQSIHSAGW